MATSSHIHEGVSVLVDGRARHNLSKIALTETEVRFLDDSLQVNLEISLSNIIAIQIHQPIFGANYIEIEFTNSGSQVSKLTVTFNKGGATEFAQSFFRATQGQVDTTAQSVTATQPESEKSSQVMTDKKSNKKND